jgi:hypothetical protein
MAKEFVNLMEDLAQLGNKMSLNNRNYNKKKMYSIAIECVCPCPRRKQD